MIARIARGADEHHVLGGEEAPVDRDVPDAALGIEGGAAARELRKHRHRLREARGGESENAYTTRPGLVTLDVALVAEGVQKVRDSLRGLDSELLGDLADARLVRVIR